MREFIESNGATWTHDAGGLDDTALTIERLAAGEIDEEFFIGWVLQRIS
jgi:hypothetical protein